MKLRLSALAACLLLSATAAQADNYPFKDGKGILQNFASILVGAIHHQKIVIEGLFSGAPKPVAVDTNGNVGVTCVSGCSGGGGSSLTKANAADQTFTEGSTTNQVSVDLNGYARSLVKGSVSLTGTLPAFAATPTFNLGTLNGASTAANQATEITSLSTIATNTGSNATAANQASVIGSKAAGTAATNSVLTGGVYNSSALTLTNGQQAALQFDANGNLKINIIAGASSGAVAQGSTTSGQTGGLTQAAVTTSAPTYTTAQTSPLSLTTGGALRVDDSASWGTQGTGATYNQPTGGAGPVGYLSGLYAAALDTTTPSPMKIDQTTPGTTNHVDAGLSAATTGGCTPYGLTSAASTNSTSVKASAGTLCSLSLVNTTATLYYLRLYNAASAPTCSSATNFVLSVPIPASATGAGVVVNTGTFGWAFTTGISFCLTGGGSSTDNTNAAAGVYLAASYK